MHRTPAPNQPPPLVDYNMFEADRALREALSAYDIPEPDELRELGALAGSAQAQDWARAANQFPPQLRTHDRFGNRIDVVEYHPAYHELIRIATAYGMHAAPWASGDASAHTLRAIKFYLWSRVEAGHGCPISMTYAAVPALRANARLAQLWEPRLEATQDAALFGMAMTEKQGGSDVRANTTRATFHGETDLGDAYRLNGDKWFCSAPMSDGFLMLAQAPGGLTCFFVPRERSDGTRNGIFIQRLKDKLGNRSNASSEIELHDAYALRVGDEGRGVQTIVEMVNCTRFDCIAGSAATMREALAQAAHHCMHRSAFGTLLIDQPLMQNVLADIAIESEAALHLTLRLTQTGGVLKRLGTAAGKYFICKRAPAVVAEALECLGGNGYVEDSGMPRLYREAPLNGIWEGSGNINALDVLRILAKAPDAIDRFRAEIEPGLGDKHVAAAANDLFSLFANGIEQSDARTAVETLVLLWQAALLTRAQSPAAELFAASRLHGRAGRTLGTLPASSALKALALRAAPQMVEYSSL